jgi:hypothetical protein
MAGGDVIANGLAEDRIVFNEQDSHPGIGSPFCCFSTV